MTKKDLRVVVLGGGVGLGALALLWWFARKTVTVPVINPATVKWEPHT
jgi:hypothetical protein